MTGYDDLKDAIREVARLTSKRARSLGLVLAVIDAFENYEGLKDRTKHDELFKEFEFWIELCGIMGIEYIQIPATYKSSDAFSGDKNLITKDLRKAAEAGLSVTPPVKVSE